MQRDSSTGIRLVQISDCHAASGTGSLYRGLDAVRSLQGLLPAIRSWQPDLLLLTGDVSEDASPASYGRISGLLDLIGIPVLALPGNHDDPDVMKQYFPIGPWEGPWLQAVKGWQFVLLDSTGREEIAGIFPANRLQRLEEGLKHADSRHVLVALHHQPVEVGSPWIDKYALRYSVDLMDLLEGDSRVRCVAFGHVHQDFAAERGSMKLLGSPSSVANSIPGQDKFTLDEGGPACRWLELGRDGGIKTGLLRA